MSISQSGWCQNPCLEQLILGCAEARSLSLCKVAHVCSVTFIDSMENCMASRKHCYRLFRRLMFHQNIVTLLQLLYNTTSEATNSAARGYWTQPTNHSRLRSGEICGITNVLSLSYQSVHCNCHSGTSYHT